MTKSLTLLVSILLLFSCNNHQENKSLNDVPQTKDSLSVPQVTVLADLPDSLQPKTIKLSEMPAPKRVANKGGVITRLPVLENERGEPILDTEGNPLIMGDGGMSHFTNFGTDNGLALDVITCSAMDHEGNLWFGTYGGGVSRYDGKSFVNFTPAQGLVHTVVFCITEDSKNNLWFGTSAGVSRYDGKAFITLKLPQEAVEYRVTSIAEDKTGNLWFATSGGGVCCYDGKEFVRYTTAQGLASNNVRSIAEDKSGNLWFGTREGVSCYNPAVAKRTDSSYFTNYTIAQGLVNNYVKCIKEDKVGNVWFGTDGGLSCYDGKFFKNYTTAEGLAHNNVSDICEDKMGNLWFSTYIGGVSKYDGKTFTTYRMSQGLANNIVWSITEDMTGSLWFGTQGSGVSKYDGNIFTNYSKPQGLPYYLVWCIMEDIDGNLWFGTDLNGVFKYDGKTFTTYNISHGLVNNSVWAILQDKNRNIWFGTEGGLSKFDGKSFTNYTTLQGLNRNHVNRLAEDKSGNLWVGYSAGGVSKYDGKSFTNYSTAQGLASNSARGICVDKTGNIWFSTSAGVSKYDGKSFINFTTAQGLAHNKVTNISEDKSGNLWFATSVGLSVLIREVRSDFLTKADKNKYFNTSKLFKSFTVTDGLPDNFVTQVIQLPSGKMAIGTNFGITLFNLAEDYSKLEDIEIYNSSTGYPVKDVNTGQNSLYLDSKGVIWAGTGSKKTALVSFDYSALQQSPDPPKVVIQSVKIEDENICWFNLQSKGVRKNDEDSAAALLQEYMAYGKALSVSKNDSILNRFGNIHFDSITPYYPIPQNLFLPYEHNQIVFEFAALETDKPFLVKYQYILEGYDKKWSPVTKKSSATFGNIREGDYTFKVKAQGANGVWSAPISYTFKVTPPWYRTWWAYLMYALLFLGALRIFSLWRERKLRAEKEKLEQTVAERTEELVQKNIIVENEKKRSDDLLLNILPAEVAEELKEKGSAEAKQFDEVTVIFTDFKGFSAMSENMSPQELVHDLNICFSKFDKIVAEHNIEKIKTIGDAYMAAGGLPTPNKTHVTDILEAAFKMRDFVESGKAKKKAAGLPYFEIRIGVHTGPLVAGIVGVKKFQYDIWGDTVNTANRMESAGQVGKINISQATYDRLKDNHHFTFESRGKIDAKGKGDMEMYFVEEKS